MSILNSIPTDVSSLLLLALLVVSFYIAFKVMQMVFQTVLVSGISAAFYLGLVYTMNYTFSFDRLLLFAFLGATLYMGYSFLSSAYTVGARVISVPYHILMHLVVKPVQYIHKKVKNHRRMKRLETNKQSFNPNEQKKSMSEGMKGTKDVVLDKVRKKEDEEE